MDLVRPPEFHVSMFGFKCSRSGVQFARFTPPFLASFIFLAIDKLIDLNIMKLFTNHHHFSPESSKVIFALSMSLQRHY